jgi:hypothetical protein
VLKRTLLSLLIINSVFTFAQSAGTLTNRGCGTPALPDKFESWVQGLSLPPGGKTIGGGQTMSVFNIPVIVHVIHNNESVNNSTTTSGNNLNAAQIIDQINILNKDFNGLNSDTSLIPAVFKPAQGKFQFNFCLAVVNPTGGVLAEPGINRIDRNAMGWNAPPYGQSYITSTIKPASIWDPSRYFNMWVMPLGSGLLGFATFPNPGSSGLSGLSAPYGTTSTDGVVMRGNAFGSVGTAVTQAPYHKGRTTTHEVGHWLGLRHIWGDNTCGNDFCNDTPPAQTSNFGCPTHPYKLGTCSGNTTGEMFMNFMDYTDDACMYMFTNDQKYRAQLIMMFSSLRLGILTSTVCNLPTATNDVGIMFVQQPTYTQSVSCTNTITPVIVIRNYASNQLTSATLSYNINGAGTQTVAWTGTLSPSTNATVTLPAITGLANGSHVFNVGIYAPNGSSDSNPINNINNQPFTISGSFTIGVNGNTTVCSGNQISLTATGSATSYTWFPGPITSSVFTATATTSSIFTVAGTFSGCVNSRTVAITVSPTPTLSVNAPNVCVGTPATLTVTGACTYTWLPGFTPGPLNTVNPGSSTIYTVFGSCGNCIASRTTTVTVFQQPTLNLSVAPTGSLCPGGTATVTATGALSYSWNTGSNSNQFTVSPPLNTVYTVTAANGPCTTTGTTQVLVGSSSLSMNVSPNPATVCTNGTLSLLANGANSYTWSTGSNNQQIFVSPLAATVYTVSGTNGICIDIVQVTVTPGPPSLIVTLTAIPSQTICAGRSATIQGNHTSGSTVVTPSTTTIYTASLAYTVMTSGPPGEFCKSTETIQIDVGIAPLPLKVNASEDSLCAGSTTTLTVSGASSYSWSTGDTTSNISVSPSANITYSVRGISGACSSDSTKTIYVEHPSPVIIAAVPSNVICPGRPATLSASGTYTSFSWSTGATGGSISATGQLGSSYSVTGMGGPNKCAGSASIILIQGSSPVSVLSATNLNCSEATCAGAINVLNTTGGIPPYLYGVENTSCTSMPCAGLCAGLYKLITTDSLGCTSFRFFSLSCISTVGLADHLISGISIFPNPAHDEVRFESTKPFAFSVFNALGEQLDSGRPNSEVHILNLAKYAPGVYFVILESEGKHFTSKLIVE